jgi:hypothetical protein
MSRVRNGGKAMKRFLRHILNGLTAISLLLCSLTLLSWQSGRSEMIEIGWSFHYVLELGWHDGRIFAGDQRIASTPRFRYCDCWDAADSSEATQSERGCRCKANRITITRIT